MFYKELSPEAKPLSPQEAGPLKKTAQEATVSLEKGIFDPKPIEKMVYRFLAVRNDLVIDEEQDTSRLVRVTEESYQIINHDLRKLEDLMICEKQMGTDDSREAILNLFPSDAMGEAFIHAVHAACRLQELQREKNKKTQERAFNNFLHLIQSLNILEDHQKAMNALQKRKEQYQKQIEAHQRNIEKSRAKGKDFDIPRSEEKIRHFEAKVEWLQSHIRVLNEAVHA